MVKIGINGFGRIGRLMFRALVEQGLLGKTLDVVAVNDLVPADNLAYLLKYDSTQGRFNGSVVSEKSSAAVAEDDLLVVNGHKIKCLAVKEGPAALPWKQLGVEYQGGALDVHAGQAVVAHPGEWVRYSTPGDEGAEYIAVCLPAFSPQTVHRDD